MNRAQVEKKYILATESDWTKFIEKCRKIAAPILGIDNITTYSNDVLVLYEKFRRDTKPQYEQYIQDLENLEPALR